MSLCLKRGSEKIKHDSGRPKVGREPSPARGQGPRPPPEALPPQEGTKGSRQRPLPPTGILHIFYLIDKIVILNQVF